MCVGGDMDAQESIRELKVFVFSPSLHAPLSSFFSIQTHLSLFFFFLLELL